MTIQFTIWCFVVGFAILIGGVFLKHGRKEATEFIKLIGVGLFALLSAFCTGFVVIAVTFMAIAVGRMLLNKILGSG